MNTRLRRATFDETSELYDRVRPGYPEAVYDDLAKLAGLTNGSRVLEIGCGTGQATVPLARRGYELVAVELGARLAEIARWHLTTFPSVRIVNANFENWALPATPFDAVVAATSFHWISSAVRFSKTAAALRPGGALAVISTYHVAGGDAQFFVDVQGCYERWMPGAKMGLALPTAAEIPSDHQEFVRSGLFGPATSRRYEWELTYTTREYLDLLLTYSDHRALEPASRQQLLTCIAELIDSHYDGQISKRYLTELAVAPSRSRR